MYRLTIFGRKKFSLTVIDDVMRYIGNGALTKKWSDGFSKSLAWTISWANKIANYSCCQIVVVFSLSTVKVHFYYSCFLVKELKETMEIETRIKDQKQPTEMFHKKKLSLKISHSSQGNTCARILFFTCTCGLTVIFSLREKCRYSEFFWPVFSGSRTEYREIRNISSYSVRMREDTDQKNSEYGHFPHSVWHKRIKISLDRNNNVILKSKERLYIKTKH